jgi:UDP-glucuronate 4-epimerase
MTNNVLITGAAGFIGSNVAYDLARRGYQITATDFITDTSTLNEFSLLRSMRIRRLTGLHPSRLQYDNCDLSDRSDVERLFSYRNFDHVIHLAGKTGDRDSSKFPGFYATENEVAFANIIDFSARHSVKNFLYASSSSVYGNNGTASMKEDETDVNHPISVYGATKRSNELMAYAMSESTGLFTTGLRLFSVYGEYGRLDMAPYLFTNAILKGETLRLFNYGKNYRDFTHISVVCHAINKLLRHSDYGIRNRMFNIGTGEPMSTTDLVHELSSIIGKQAFIYHEDAKIGDVEYTFADTFKMGLNNLYPMYPKSRKEHLTSFVNWVKLFHTFTTPPNQNRITLKI